MRKKDPFGRHIKGVTDAHQQEWFEKYINRKDWESAHIWLNVELPYLHKKVVRNRIGYNVFGVLMSLVMAFFTWVILYPSADEKELAVFPLVTVCKNLYTKLCAEIGEVVLIIGLISAPFIVAVIAALGFSFIGKKRYTAKIKNLSVESKIERLDREYDKYNNEFVSLLLYALFAGIFTGGVMVFSSVPGGMNPFEYLILAVIFDVIYGVIFFAVVAVMHWCTDWFGVKSYSCYNWKNTVQRANGTYKSYPSEPDPLPDVTNYESDEEWAARIVRETELELTGRGYGDY